jgi:hypothetical protein
VIRKKRATDAGVPVSSCPVEGPVKWFVQVPGGHTDRLWRPVLADEKGKLHTAIVLQEAPRWVPMTRGSPRQP